MKDRVAVITGASRGLGAGIARVFAERGLRLGLCARATPALEDGPRVVAQRVDVTDATALEAFRADVVARFDAIDLWINNAGVLEPIAPLRDISADDWRRHIEVNLTGSFLGSRCFVRHLRARGGEGVLINISSGASSKAYHGWSAYCAGKAGVDHMTRCLDLEEHAHGLRAYSVAPGVIDTDMQVLIRSSSPDDFPELPRFRRRKAEGGFNSAAFVADLLLEIAFDETHRPDEVCVRLPDKR